MAVNGVAMYKLPGFYNVSDTLELPECMYKTKNYHVDSVDYMATGQSPQQENLESLEERQENILKELESLRNEISGLADKLGVKLPAKRGPASLDLVVSASPQDPPLSIFVIQQLMNQREMTHSTAVFVHSSVTVTELQKLPAFEKPLKDLGRKSPCMLTVIWKNVSNLPSLVVSSNHTPLVGESTIARHLCRTILPGLYGKLSLEDLAHVDHWLGLAQHSLLSGNSKGKASVLHNLNSHLGKNQWLVGGKLSLADIVVASAVVKTDSSSSAPANVKQWLKNFPVLC